MKLSKAGKQRLSALTLMLLILGVIPTLAASPLTLDVCRFRGDGGMTYMEVYLDHARSAVTHKEVDGVWYGALLMSLEMKRADKTLAKDSWIIEDVVDSTEALSGSQRLIDVRIYHLAPGDYQLNVAVKDSISGKEWDVSRAVTIDRYVNVEFNLSDIEFGSHIIPSDMQEKFSRGDFGIIPNPRRIFGGKFSFFVYYVEIYPSLNQLRIIDSSGVSQQEFLVERSVLNGVKDTVLTLPTIIHKATTAQAFADIDSVVLDGLSTGAYSLQLTITGPDQKSIGRRERFFIYQKDIQPELAVKPMNIEDPEAEISEIDFLLSIGQRKLLKTMNLDEKREFMQNFWKLYDDDLTTVEVPLRMLFRGRVEEADRRWSNSQRPGHKTAEGRVYVLYGEPNNIDRSYLELDSKPYDIWTYDHLGGGAVFVFVDRSGLGQYELVHSTRKGEISNSNWYEMFVLRSGTGSGR